MRAIPAAAPGLIAALCIAAIAGCGGKGTGDPPVPVEPAQAAAIASVERLGAAVDDGQALRSCRALTAATRRVVALTGRPGATCPSALEDFLVVYGLDKTLPGARDLRAAVTGTRAVVQGPGLDQPLTSTREQDGWRVSFLQLPGVRGDVTAARACGSYLDDADALALPPLAPAALAARLREDAGLVDGLQRALGGLPAGGPARVGLPTVLQTLTVVGSQLRAQARRVAEGGSVPRAIQSTAEADRLVRGLLKAEGAKARIACPLDATKGPELAARRKLLDAACRDFGRTIGRLDSGPVTPEEARALLAEVDAALVRFDDRLRRAPVAERLRPLRTRARRAVSALRTEVAAIPTSSGGAALDASERRIDGYGAQVDAALIRLGATCLDGRRGTTPPRGGTAPPAPTPAPSPPPSPSLPPSPDLPRDTVES